MNTNESYMQNSYPFMYTFIGLSAGTSAGLGLNNTLLFSIIGIAIGTLIDFVIYTKKDK